jgi:hypothetical protein
MNYATRPHLLISKGARIVRLGLGTFCAAIAAGFFLGGAASAANITTSTTADAPAVLLDGTNVFLFVPDSTDNSLRMGSMLKQIEPIPTGTASAPKTVVLKTGYTDSCAASPATGEVVCSNLFGSASIVTIAGGTKIKVTGFKSGVTQRIHFTGGDCANCGVAIDDGLSGGPTAFISTSKGYLPVQLTPFSIQPIIPTNGEAISGQFGYDPINHRILSPNYALLNLKHFNSGPPHYQIIEVGTGAAFDLSDGGTFFNANGMCNTISGGMTQRDALPDSGAYDINTGIAYGTFRSPSDCIVADTVEDIALFDLTQASFDSSNGTWSDSGKQIQTLAEMTDLSNGITGIAIVPGQSLAIVADRREASGGGGGFGALSLPTTSGSGVPAIQDWVQAEMPSDPSGKPWLMSYMPNGLTAYVSPNNAEGYGVIVNRTRTYAAIVDLAKLLAASRQTGTMHTLSSSVNLVTDGIVRFVDIRPGKS